MELHSTSTTPLLTECGYNAYQTDVCSDSLEATLYQAPRSMHDEGKMLPTAFWLPPDTGTELWGR